MKVIIAPDKFKGALTSSEAAQAIARGLRAADPEAEIVQIPIADGGEGTMALISELLGAETEEVRVMGPMGEPVMARYGMAGARAILEMSAASGLLLVPEEQRDPWGATTYGTGEMIIDALRKGADEILIGIGGSATNDGGVGMAEALGYEFYLNPDNALTRIFLPEDRPGDMAKFIVACDVSNPLLGPRGCTRVYGPQKGILPEDFERHEARLYELAEVVDAQVAPISPETPGAGAAGGLGFGLMAFCAAELRPGFDLVAELTGLRAAIVDADLVITGEGCMDAQTLMGKGPVGVADLARAAGRKVVAFCGVAKDEAALLERFDEVISLETVAGSAGESMARAAQLLEEVSAAHFRSLA